LLLLLKAFKPRVDILARYSWARVFAIAPIGRARSVLKVITERKRSVSDPRSSRLLKSGSYFGFDLSSGNFVALMAARHVFAGVAGSVGAP